MTARDAGAIASKSLAIIVLLLGVQQLAVLPGLVAISKSSSDFDRGTMSTWDMFRPLLANITLIAAHFLGAALLWFNAGRFWSGSTEDRPSASFEQVQRLTYSIFGTFLIVRGVPRLVWIAATANSDNPFMQVFTGDSVLTVSAGLIETGVGIALVLLSRRSGTS